MPLITDLIVELAVAKRETKDLIEGFRDLRGALEREGRTPALSEIDALLNVLTVRYSQIESSEASLNSLVKGNYPTPVPLVVSPEAAGVLAEQVRTQTLAFDSITVPTDAATASVTVGVPVPKP